MKVIPTAASRRINTYQYMQKPVRIPAKQQYDSVSFGRNELVIDGDYTNLETLDETSINIKGNATLGDASAITDFTIGKTLTANSISANTACLKGRAQIANKADVADLVAIGKFTTTDLECQTAHFLHGATINGNATDNATVTVVNGDLQIKGNTDLARIYSSGGIVELGEVSRLNSIVLSNPNPNAIPMPEKFPTRVLKLNSANVVPAKIRVVLDKFQKLVVEAPEAVLNKLEFCKFNDRIEGFVGEALGTEAIERLIKLVKRTV